MPENHSTIDSNILIAPPKLPKYTSFPSASNIAAVGYHFIGRSETSGLFSSILNDGKVYLSNKF